MTADVGAPVAGEAATGAPGEPSHHPAIPDQPPGKSMQAARWNELFNLAKSDHHDRDRPETVAGPAGRHLRRHGVRRGTWHLAADRAAEHRSDRRPAGAVGDVATVDDPCRPATCWCGGRPTTKPPSCTAGVGTPVPTSKPSFTIDDAERMKLTGKGNWATMPTAMLMARVTSLLGRMLFADVLLGMAYTPEELGAVGPYAAIDLDYDPDSDRHVLVDPETGEILDEDNANEIEQRHPGPCRAGHHPQRRGRRRRRMVERSTR